MHVIGPPRHRAAQRQGGTPSRAAGHTEPATRPCRNWACHHPTPSDPRFEDAPQVSAKSGWRAWLACLLGAAVWNSPGWVEQKGCFQDCLQQTKGRYWNPCSYSRVRVRKRGAVYFKIRVPLMFLQHRGVPGQPQSQQRSRHRHVLVREHLQGPPLLKEALFQGLRPPLAARCWYRARPCVAPIRTLRPALTRKVRHALVAVDRSRRAGGTRVAALQQAAAGRASLTKPPCAKAPHVCTHNFCKHAHSQLAMSKEARGHAGQRSSPRGARTGRQLQAHALTCSLRYALWQVAALKDWAGTCGAMQLGEVAHTKRPPASSTGTDTRSSGRSFSRGASMMKRSCSACLFILALGCCCSNTLYKSMHSCSRPHACKPTVTAPQA